jgi:quercetin dioxygenase-like cupin family protein
MNKELAQIPSRIKELREILEIPVNEMAEELSISEEKYLSYENGELDIPISALYAIAAKLGTDFTVLLTGESPRMNTQTVVRKGNGVKVDRYEGYSFVSLASNYIGRVMEPMLVTIEPSDKEPAPVMHGGQEFNYVVSGKVKITVGQREHILEAGDSIYFDPRVPHGQSAIDGTATFLTVILE